MKRRGFSIIALLAVGLLAGCGSVSDGLAFHAPKGWSSTPSVLGRFQMWTKAGHGSDSTQMVMLVKGVGATNKQIFSRMNVSGNSMRDVRVDTITICGHERASHFVGEGSSKTGATTMEGVSVVTGGTRYIAMYMRPRSMRPDAQAEAAIHSLCPKAS